MSTKLCEIGLCNTIFQRILKLTIDHKGTETKIPRPSINSAFFLSFSRNHADGYSVLLLQDPIEYEESNNECSYN